MTSRSTARVRARFAAAVPIALAGALAAGCGGGETPDDTASTSAGSGTSTGTTTPSATSPSPSATASATASPSPSGEATDVSACARQTADALTEEQALGQLLMVAFDTAAPRTALDDLIADQHVGNVIYLGGWEGAARVKETSTHLQAQATKSATAGIPLLLAADQEGGEVRQLRGEGFSKVPSAKVQAQMSSNELTAAAKGWAGELKAVGINVNLAPVTDTVPAEIGRANEPIGKFARQYGSTPATVEKASTAFLKGMIEGGVMGTVKHFPGLGRVENNTDFNTTGITDSVATTNDPFLAPFTAGVKAGAGLVMVSSARYPGLDPTETQAMFSKPIITDLLRGRLGFDGVVITDDINAKAVRSIPAARRATTYIEAGGDILLTGDPESVPAMTKALADKARADEGFATLVDASVLRVIALKERMGLVTCG
ncbi:MULTISPECIES: glycoside hydrolase family 3 N-terminal domain-containing protein [unclassified Knoellia]|uniref:glycoside hydrolase family 3 N-terminal domain-containing protein n=1 Tax=Knoellia altitudinis TaxID=3404795 RepID=UPI00361010EB